MKIHNGNHLIKQLPYIKEHEHIPLSYIDQTDDKDINIDIVPTKSYIKDDVKIEVLPYKNFDSIDTILLDGSMNIMKNELILHRNHGKNTYYFLPINSSSDSPTRFDYKIKAKKNVKYNSNDDYNMEIACIDSSTRLETTKKLITLFGDAPITGVAPTNVSVNNQDTEISSLIREKAIEDIDILFIESEDGTYYKDSEIKIDYKELEEANVNVWLLITSDSYKSENVSMIHKEQTANISKGIAIKNQSISTSRAFKTKNIDTEEKQHNLFNTDTPGVLITENIGKNFIITSEYGILDQIASESKAIYEVLLFIHFNSYKESKYVNTWIYHQMPDLVYDKKGILINKNTFNETIDTMNMFNEKQENIELLSVTTSNSNIDAKINNNSIISFSIKNKTSYVKDKDVVSVFTIKQDIIHYKEIDKVYEYYASPKIDRHFIEENQIRIILSPIINSEKGLYIKEKIELRVKIDTTVDTIRKEYIYNNFNIITNSETERSDLGELIAVINIKIKSKQDIVIHDLRRPGGGLIDQEHDYNLLDMGNCNGRPYRKGGSIIITLPESLKMHKHLIEKAIDKHIVAGSFYVLLFE